MYVDNLIKKRIIISRKKSVAEHRADAPQRRVRFGPLRPPYEGSGAGDHVVHGHLHCRIRVRHRDGLLVRRQVHVLLQHRQGSVQRIHSRYETFPKYN